VILKAEHSHSAEKLDHPVMNFTDQSTTACDGNADVNVNVALPRLHATATFPICPDCGCHAIVIQSFLSE